MSCARPMVSAMAMRASTSGACCWSGSDSRVRYWLRARSRQVSVHSGEKWRSSGASCSTVRSDRSGRSTTYSVIQRTSTPRFCQSLSASITASSCAALHQRSADTPVCRCTKASSA